MVGVELNPGPDNLNFLKIKFFKKRFRSQLEKQRDKAGLET